MDVHPIKHRSLQNHYTAYVSWKTDPTPPLIDHRCMQHHYTEYVSYIAECTDTNGIQTHPLL